MSHVEENVEAMIRSIEQDYSLESLANINKAALEFGTAGNPTAAQRLLERALTIYEAHYGADTLDFSVLLHNLALQLEAQDNFDAARKLFMRALELREQRLGHDNLELVGCLDALGRLSAKTDQSNDDRLLARSLFRRALSIRESYNSADDLETADCLRRLAATYDHIIFGDDQIVKLRYLKRALYIYEDRYGENSPEVAHVLLGHLILASLPGNSSEVIGYVDQAIAIFETNYKIQSMKKTLRALYQDLSLLSSEVAATMRQRLDGIDKTILHGI
jgi:tetratricopeptide (TPR) repeat protein